MGGPLFPNVYVRIPKKVNTFVETKNAPEGLKRKINPQIFFGTEASQIGGVGGSDIWEKLPKNPIFFSDRLPNKE